MALPPAATPPTFSHHGTNDARAQSHADPFYQSTPRINPSGLSTLMAAVQQVVPQSLPTRLSRPPAPRTRVPACTHTTMTRVYGANPCHQCGRIPSIGWLYSCCQDSMPPTHDLAASESVDTLPTVANSGSYFEAQAQIAASIGMSASVIKQMRTGAYTYDQIEMLLAQRRHVIDTIRRTKNPSTASLPPTPQSPTQTGDNRDSIIASAGTTASSSSPVAISRKLNVATLSMPSVATPCDSPAGSLVANPSATVPKDPAESPQKNQVGQKEICTYQVCHTCRPFFQDRLHMSLEPALNNEVPALREGEMMTLPIQNAGVVSNLGLRRCPAPSPLRRSKESMDITMHQRDGYGYESFGHDTSSDWTPTTTSSEADSDMSGNFDPSPCPGPGICAVWISSEGCAYELGFDDGKREINHGYGREEIRLAQGLGIAGTDLPVSQLPGSLTSTPDRSATSKGSSVSLPNPPTTPLTAATMSSSYSCSLPDRPSPASNNSSKSSAGSEVEVAGGVALTEEAVGSGTPDIAVK